MMERRGSDLNDRNGEMGRVNGETKTRTGDGQIQCSRLDCPQLSLPTPPPPSPFPNLSPLPSPPIPFLLLAPRPPHPLAPALPQPYALSPLPPSPHCSYPLAPPPPPAPVRLSAFGKTDKETELNEEEVKGRHGGKEREKKRK